VRNIYETVESIPVLTIVTLSYAVLNATTLCEIGDLSPIFVGVDVGFEFAEIMVTATRC
jgi:hypothetical protein